LPLLRLRNPVRDYPWGGTSAIPDLLGYPADGTPQAELWLGAHPDSPSTLPDGRRLDDAVAADPEQHLGAAVRAQFGPRLPFLLKVLAAAAPLSLQVHPDARQAQAGYDDEEARGVPRDSGQRRYRDPFHKPELLVALDPFEALCGLRDPEQTLELLARLDVADPAWPALLERLAEPDPASALTAAVGWLLGGDERVPPLVDAVAAAAAAHPDSPELVTAAELAAAYPRDPGVLVALLLNRVTLLAGEALFLPAGNLHAYLRGTALEVMAASDNVLRAGLTGKHVDVAELLRITDFTPRPLPVVRPERVGPLTRYRPDVADFTLVRADLSDPHQWYDVCLSGPRVLLALAGTVEARLADGGPNEGERLARGESAYVASADGPLCLRGTGTAVVAGSPAAAPTG
jgi:mannose-6-phosphate isomerase